jgi:hypothetical protein
MNPQPVHIEIGDLHEHRGRGAAPANSARKQLGWQEVRAHDRIRRALLHLEHDATRIRLLDAASQAIPLGVRAALVSACIQVRPDERCTLDELQVGVGVGLAKRSRHEVEHVQALALKIRLARCGCSDRLSRAHMPGTR